MAFEADLNLDETLKQTVSNRVTAEINGILDQIRTKAELSDAVCARDPSVSNASQRRA